ncbi:MAG: TlpA disulfide reductase family protein [Prevotella sp.]|nr:TlpA disulfide reductase family protein [Prevotella sp.]
MKINHLFSMLAIALAALCITSCSDEKFHVSGTISNAQDSLLYFENMSLNGPVTVDSVKLGKDGSFSFDGDAPKNPEFYRLRIDRQIINVAIDSTENITVKATYPQMSAQYDIEGSEECLKIKELAQMQLNLQATVNAIQQDPRLNYDQVDTAIQTALKSYKDKVKLNYIFKAPMKAYAYFALFQTIVVGNQVGLIFNPHASKEDVQAYAAVATSWDTYYPGSERGKNLHNIAIAGMKDLRIVEAQQAQTIPADKVNTAGVLEIALPDNKGVTRKLTSLKGKVVLLDFHIFASEGSTARIMKLRELYNKYHAQGLEIYQVSLDPDEHFWKESVAALPWVCVHDEDGTDSQYAAMYNVQSVPTFFLIDRNNTLQKRDAQIKDLDAEIKALL